MRLRSVEHGTCTIRIAGIAREALLGNFLKPFLLACEAGSFQRHLDHGRHIARLPDLVDVRRFRCILHFNVTSRFVLLRTRLSAIADRHVKPPLHSQASEKTGTPRDAQGLSTGSTRETQLQCTYVVPEEHAMWPHPFSCTRQGRSNIMPHADDFT